MYQHKTESYGASHVTNYKVITRCVFDCPACAFNAGKLEGRKEVVEWARTEIIALESHLDKKRSEALHKRWQAKLKEWGIDYANQAGHE